MVRLRFYTLTMLIPSILFFAGALSFAVPIALFHRAPSMISIGVALSGWLMLAVFSIVVRCPSCGKSPYNRMTRAFGMFPLTWGGPWPERQCSKCGHSFK